MTTFRYEGTLATGRAIRGVVTAESIRAARDRLRDDGVVIRKITARSESPRWSGLLTFRGRRYARNLTEYMRDLATLLQAGVPLIDAMDTALLQSSKKLLPALLGIRESVASGKSLAEAMQGENWLFDEMTIGMVRVGEHAGNLDEILEMVAEFREQSYQSQDRVLSSILYPAIVFFVSVVVTIFLMTFVVPMLLQNLVELQKELPWPTRVLKFLSDGLLEHGWWLISLAVIASIAFLLWKQSATGTEISSRFVLAVPLWGNLVRKQEVGRMAKVVACLLRSGLELVEAISIAEKSCSNRQLQLALAQVRRDIEVGGGLREAFAKHAVFPIAVSHIFAIGQQSGQLDSMLDRLGKDYDRQAAALSSRVTAVAEPLLIIVLSFVVGFILFATILPILEAGNVLSS